VLTIASISEFLGKNDNPKSLSQRNKQGKITVKAIAKIIYQAFSSTSRIYAIIKFDNP